MSPDQEKNVTILIEEEITRKILEKTIGVKDTNMVKHVEFKKGNKIIENGKVYIIFKVETVINDGHAEKIIHYRPHYDSNKVYSTLICSIPERNIISSNIRKPVSQNKLNDVITYISKEFEGDEITINLIKANEKFRLNSVYDTASVIKQCVAKQKYIGEDFNFNKKGLLGDAVDMILEEVALVYQISLKEALQKIKIAAKTYYSVINMEYHQNIAS